MSGHVPTDDPAGAGGAVPSAAEPATQPPPAEVGAAAAPEPAGAAAAPVPETAAPAAEFAPAEPAVKPHTDTETLLEAAWKQPEGETKPAEAAATPPGPAARTYEDFKLPEGFTAEPEKLAAFHEVIGRHNLDQDAAQRLVDMHTANLQAYAERLRADQHSVFAETRANWRKEVMADEQLGGAGHQTSMAAIARMRDLLVPEQRRAAFDDMLRVTGAGDHPEFLRVMHNAARYFDEPPAPSHQGNPPANIGRAPGRARFNYDHPSSAKVRGS